jgi:uncharacterized protein YjiS (DUF1127 family)
MRTFGLLLPPQIHSVWRPKDRREALPPLVEGLVLIARWIERARQRRALGGLDDHMLRDIGITRVEATREAGKPFWK